MDALPYLRRAAGLATEDPTTFREHVSLNLVSNVTDAVLGKLLIGLCLEQGLYPNLYSAPYRQYPIELKDPASGLMSHPADISFVLFDLNVHTDAALMQDEAHLAETMDDLERWCASHGKTVVFTTIPTPYRNAYGNLFEHDPVYAAIARANARLRQIAENLSNVRLCDIDRLLHRYGEARARDLRHVHASDIPFTTEFSLMLCREWLSYLHLGRGKMRKCIVLDLDNTLWGGVVGEVGTHGVELGQGYPGGAFQSFQRALLACHSRGILLAVNSRNNPDDALEVFDNNPHMLIKRSHLAAMAINWNDKAQNLIDLAKELNIGVDSLVFFDDDKMNREMVRSVLPEVLVPELGAPETYTDILHGIDELYQLSLTEEDKARSSMAAEERARREVLSVSKDVNEYIASLGIVLKVRRDPTDIIPRLAQLTQKTNQFNLTSLRLNEADVEQAMTDGAVFAGDVVDRFGQYGTTLLAIVRPVEGQQAMSLDIFLMSCRVMGRGVEAAFMDAIVKALATGGVGTLHAAYAPTTKNPPCKDFLPHFGFAFAGPGQRDSMTYVLDLATYQTDPAIVRPSIQTSLL